MLDTHFASQYPDTAHFDQIEQIIRFMKEGNSSQVIGLPGAGKSNVLELLAYNKSVRIKHLGDQQKNVHFVYVNFAEVRNKPLFDVMKFLFFELSDSLQEREFEEAYTKSKEILKEHLSFQDELVLFQGFKKVIDYLTGEKGLTIVFLFDRFETYVPKVTEDFFSNLRTLRNRAKYKFSVVFSLNRPLEDAIEPALFADFYEFLAGHTIYIPLEDKPIQEFRIKHLEQATGKTISKDHLHQVLTLTAGHGKLTRVCLELLLSPNSTPLSETLDTSFFLASKPVTGALWEIWYYLTPNEQTLIRQLPQASATNAFLEKIGLLKGAHIAIPLFEDFIKTIIPEAMPTKETISYDPAMHTISRGNVILSDKLTVSEFRLLQFLLEHPDTVVDRETIIHAVWKDAKTIAGVTDQAVDQLIFRLRKKIEDDPNNPKHLQTVKGRGIKFLP